MRERKTSLANNGIRTWRNHRHTTTSSNFVKASSSFLKRTQSKALEQRGDRYHHPSICRRMSVLVLLSSRRLQQDHEEQQQEYQQPPQGHHTNSALENGIGFLILMVLIAGCIIFIRRYLSRLEEDGTPFFKVWGAPLQRPTTSENNVVEVPSAGTATTTTTASITHPILQEIALMAHPHLILAPEFQAMHQHKYEMDSKVANKRRNEIHQVLEQHSVQRVSVDAYAYSC